METLERSPVASQQFKLALNSKLEEMAKVADLKAMFSQDPPVGKPPPAARKPPVAASKPKPAAKAPSHTNGASVTVPRIPNGLAKELSSVRLKPSDKPTPASRPSEKPSNDSGTQGNIDFRSRLKKVSDSPVSVSTKPTVTPKPSVKPPFDKPAHKPSITPKPRVAPPPTSSQTDKESRGSDSTGRHPSTTSSIGSIKSDNSKEDSYRLATLPSLASLGAPPRKPPKPSHVSLPLPTGVSDSKSWKPFSSSHSQPALPPKPPELPPPPSPPEDDFNGTYDDVEKPPPPLPPTTNRPSLKNRISLIPTMDSDDENDADELYDDGMSAAVSDGPPPPILPSLETLPVHHQTSAGSSSSHIQTSGNSENTGSGDDHGGIYDPVEADCDELYEPLDMEHGTSGLDASNLEKEKEAERKRQEKNKKDQERQQKKEEERKKKEEKEEKKRKEKAEKELKKKFKLKGDWIVLGTGTALQDVADESDKMSVICSQGEALEIIRKDGPNPPGKWLVKNTFGDPGYIDAHLVRTADDDFGDTYDDVGLSGDGDFQDVYDIAS